MVLLCSDPRLKTGYVTLRGTPFLASFDELLMGQLESFKEHLGYH